MKTLKLAVKLAVITGFLNITIALGAEAKAPKTSRLISALIRVESNGNDNAIGDRHMNDHAYGPLQIRKPCVDDVNKRFGTKIKVESLLGNRSLSIWVCNKYIEMYATKSQIGRVPTDEDKARIWNGGPMGWRSKSTNQYWTKVKRAMAT